jgi:hypothetical protein
VGRAWQYIVWDGPWRALFWDESLMSAIVAKWGWEWSDWATSLQVAHGISYFTTIVGLLLLLGALLAWWKVTQRWRWIWFTYAGLLLLHTLLNWKGHAWQGGYLVEHSLQWTTPLWFVLLGVVDKRTPQVWLGVRIAIALTFIGHGLYAMGYYPVPPHFVGMMMSGFGLSEHLARDVLWIIGWLDFLAAIALLLPFTKGRKFALAYIIIWAFLTAVARLYANAAWYSWPELLSQWVPEFLVRWCHFLVPIALWYHWKVTPEK